MHRKILFSILFISMFFLLVSCEWRRVTPTPQAEIANPASVYCQEHEGKLDIRTDASGVQVGICIFPDGSECEEWAYFRGACAPAGSAAIEIPPPNGGKPNPASVYCEKQGGKLDIRTDASAGQVGICVFSDGSECEEWAYFHGQCAPGDSKLTSTP